MAQSFTVTSAGDQHPVEPHRSRSFDPKRWYGKHREHLSSFDVFEHPYFAEFCSTVGRGRIVLDPACGTGRDLEIGVRYGMRMIGCDLVPPVGSITADNQHIVAASFGAIPVASGCVDGIWANAAVVHASDAAALAAVREFKRVGRDSCQLFLTVKASDELDEHGFDSQGRWFNLWNEDRLRSTLTRAGWDVTNMGLRRDFQRPAVLWLETSAVPAAAAP